METNLRQYLKNEAFRRNRSVDIFELKVVHYDTIIGEPNRYLATVFEKSTYTYNSGTKKNYMDSLERHFDNNFNVEFIETAYWKGRKNYVTHPCGH